MLKKLIHTFLNFLFPQKCVGCGIKNNPPSDGLCDECLAKIDYSGGAPRPYIFAASAYNDAYIKKTIWLLKYRGARGAAESLAKLIYERAGEARLPIGSRASKSNWIIIPIPLSKKRLRERGFNQSELIGKHLSARMSVRMETNVLYKKFHTETQVSVKDKNERLKNLKGSFGVKNPDMIRGANIILIDDVCTTGATISEARKVLREAGAKKVIAFVVASG
ncbi:ComF family protein [Candidatus Parcubacteria bacterium]|nr:ComF family protein [Patescibacteria group bacterium]MBU4477325.1 ComF family protein [Patescibacteria group bacterium]MCG2699374.1 ComF family protein [Candidatus Parcubacteria bacterium]